MRYRIGSLWPGTVVHTPTGFVETNAIDGGATLTKEQIAFFKAGGYDLTAVRGEAPAPPTATSAVIVQKAASEGPMKA